jgi:hypothetical protein
MLCLPFVTLHYPFERILDFMTTNILCHLIGHKWRYKDYTNSLRWDGKRYSFTSLRKCIRCEEHEYKYDNWVKKEKALPDDMVKL